MRAARSKVNIGVCQNSRTWIDELEGKWDVSAPFRAMK